MYEIGTKKLGKSNPISREASLQVGKLYQIQIQASQGIIDSKRVAEYILSMVHEQYPESQITWIQVCEQYQTINLQFTIVPYESLGIQPQPQRLFIATLLAWLPAILTLIGISAIAVSAWEIVAGIPWWAWALLGTGLFLLLFGPMVSRLFQARAPVERVIYAKRRPQLADVWE